MRKPSELLAAVMATVGKAHPSNVPFAAFYSKRQGNRPVSMTVKCALFETEATPVDGATAPTDERQFTAYITREEWRDVTPPQIGDWVSVKFPKETDQSWLKVASVRHMVTGDFRLNLSFEPKRRPPWLR